MTPPYGLRCVVVQIDFVGLCNDFTVRVVAARWANMVWALQLTAGCALVRVRITKSVVGPTVVATGFGDFILWDSHCDNLGVGPII